MSYETAAGTDRRLVAGAFRRRWTTIVAAVLAGLLLGAAAGAARPEIYKSTMTIIIAPLEGNPYAPESLDQRNEANTDVQTDARLAATPAVAGLVEHALNLAPGSLAWRSRLSVSVVPNSQVITVAYRSADGAKAKGIAEAFGESYLSYRARRSQASVASQLAALDERSQQVQKSLTAAAKTLDSSSSRSDRAYLNQQVATYTQQLAAIAAESARLSSASRNPGQVLTPAGDPVVNGLTPLTYGALGAIGGLLLGLAIAIAREWGDRRLHDADAVEEAGVPVLAELRVSERAGTATGGRLDGDAEQYRVLRTAVAARAPAPRVIVVSALSGTVQTDELSMRLGEALSRTGHEVTVVLTAPSPRHDWLAGGDLAPGLSDVLLGGSDPLEVRASVAPGLYLVKAGQKIERASERFITEDMEAALHALAGSGDYVVVAAPGAGGSDALALAAAGDEMVVVCELHVSTRGELAASVRELRRVGGQLMGAVVVRRPRRSLPSLRRSAGAQGQASSGQVSERLERIAAITSGRSAAAPPDGAVEAPADGQDGGPGDEPAAAVTAEPRGHVRSVRPIEDEPPAGR
ncbi:MAG: hypothetical protein ACJ74O_16390 [Frankiaceae bacterium]